MRLQPSAANACAIARPIPREAPVTRATLPLRLPRFLMSAGMRLSRYQKEHSTKRKHPISAHQRNARMGRLHAVGTLADQRQEFRASFFFVAEDSQHRRR